MEMKCTKCGKEVTPLELYDGSWSCPACRHSLVTRVDRFVVTHDNEELFRQSEILYGNWLFNHDGTADAELIDKATRLCRQSAQLGNPKALARLAYFFDKDYVGTKCSESTRFKIAYNYYSTLCYSSMTTVETEPGIPPVQWDELRKQTAYSMLRMLCATPSELRDNEQYDLRSNFDRVQNALGIDVDMPTSSSVDERISFADRVFNVLCSCMDKQRAPLFGVYKLTVGDLIKIYKKPFPGKELKIPHALYWLTTSKKVLLSYIRSKYISDGEAMFTRLSTQNSVETMVDELTDDEEIYVFFFNNNGGHKYLNSQGKRDKVKRTIYDRTGTDLLKMMLQNGSHDFYTFYDDDIYFCMKQKNIAEATKALVRKICSGGEEI